MDVLGIIPAKSRSSEIRGKNLVVVNDQPMIHWTLDAAQRSQLTKLIVLTDSHLISGYTHQQYGIETRLVDTSVGMLALTRSLLEEVKPEYFMLLQPTSPLRLCEDIDNALSLLPCDCVLGVAETHAPNYCFASEDSEPMTVWPNADPLRQELPVFYQVNGAIYLLRSSLFLESGTFFPPSKRFLVMPPERSIDIDHWWQITCVEALLKQLL